MSSPLPAGRTLSGVPVRHLAVPGTALVVLAAGAWVLTVRQARGMATEPGTMGMDVGPFLVMWTAMMAAMMFPSVAPIAVAWTRSITARSTGVRRAARLGAFATGYLLSWAGYGIAAYFVLDRAARYALGHQHAAPWLGAAIFAAAGIYQLTPIKDVCLSHCRSPLAQLVHFGRFRGPLRDLRVGVHHGAYCVACCWALMLVLVAVGVMNVAVMAGLAVVILVEKLWRHGPTFGKAVGVALLLLAVLVPGHPRLAPALHHPGGMPMDMPMDMPR
jgi:predicted metal-binding membrane protein